MRFNKHGQRPVLELRPPAPDHADMTHPACSLCGDTVYDGEAPIWADDVHEWCAIMKYATNMCTTAMAMRREKGLPTPTTHPFKFKRIGHYGPGI